jgi:CRISPR-associated protein Csb2
MTVALEIEFLTGRCVASRRDDRTATEWPPHPTRLFSALSAAFFECDFGDAERAALEWLEQQSPPTISAPRVSVRTGAASFVPVNPGEKEANEQYIKRKKIHDLSENRRGHRFSAQSADAAFSHRPS